MILVWSAYVLILIITAYYFEILLTIIYLEHIFEVFVYENVTYNFYHHTIVWNLFYYKLPADISISIDYSFRLFDSPATPKTLLEKCSSTPAPRCRIINTTINSANKSILSSSNTAERPRAVASNFKNELRPHANVNPFTPNGKIMLKS